MRVAERHEGREDDVGELLLGNSDGKRENQAAGLYLTTLQGSEMLLQRFWSGFAFCFAGEAAEL